MYELGLTPYMPHSPPAHADPDNASCKYHKYSYSKPISNCINHIDHVFSAAILAASFAGRWYAPKVNVTRIPFTVNIIMVPLFYYLAIHNKEKRFAYGHEARRTFEQNLEFYPITRRAFNRAKAIREQEISKQE